MKPGHIRVFDGLRITTEHMEHLQSAFHSALGDVRQILGLGKIQVGFEVSVAEAGGAVIVQPGVAFDLEKNRIVSDEPRRLTVSFDSLGAAQFVCLQYAQVEDGVVESVPTLIWDSGAVLLQGTMPAPEDNLIAIARIEPGESGAIRVTPLPELPVEEQPAVEQSTGLEIEQPFNKGTEPVVPPIAQPEDKIGVVPAITPALPPGDSSNVPSNGANNGNAGPHPLATGLIASMAETHLVVRLGVIGPEAGLAGIVPLSNSLLEPLRQRLIPPKGQAGEQVNGAAASAILNIPLAEKALPLDIAVAGLTVQAVLRGSLRISLPGEAPATSEGSTAEVAETAERQEIELAFQADSLGEAAPGAISGNGYTHQVTGQFGVTHMQTSPGAWSARPPRLCSGWLAEVFFADLLEGADDGLSAACQPLDSLRLAVCALVDGAGLWKLAVKLVWEGGLDAAMVNWIETQPVSFGWEACLAWKALGEL